MIEPYFNKGKCFPVSWFIGINTTFKIFASLHWLVLYIMAHGYKHPGTVMSDLPEEIQNSSLEPITMGLKAAALSPQHLSLL